MFDDFGHPPAEHHNVPNSGGQLPQLGGWKSISALIESQQTILCDVVRRARRSPFYSQRLGDDFSKAQVTTKGDLRENSPFGFLAVKRREVATYHESSGTSGEPTSSYFTDSDWEDVVSRFLRNAVGVTSEDSVLVKTPYSLVTTAHQMHLAARYRGAMVVPGDNRSSNIPYSKVIRILEQIPITVAWCMPTEVFLWAEAARLAGKNPATDFAHLRAFFVAGEPLTEAKRKRMENVWGGTPVFQDYGSTETGSLAGECPFGRLHLWADRLYCEVWNESEKGFSLEGQGKLVVTPLYRKAMPLVRYGLEDTVEISHSPCECGWNLPIIRILGRSESTIQVQDRTFFPSDLEEAVYSLPCELGVHFWRARYDARRLEIEIEGHVDAVAALKTEIARKLGIDSEVRMAPLPLVSKQRLVETSSFNKPKFVFSASEDWSKAIHY